MYMCHSNKLFPSAVYSTICTHAHAPTTYYNYWTDMYMYMIEPQVPWLRTAIYHTGLDVKMEVTQCAGRVSANTRHHQLHWGDREWAYYMCTSITLTVLYSIPTSSSLRSFLTYRISLMTVMNPSSVAN